jgi:hypothetical protein
MCDRRQRRRISLQRRKRADPLSFAVDAMSLSWDGMFAYAFPPFRFLIQVLLKIKQRQTSCHYIEGPWNMNYQMNV